MAATQDNRPVRIDTTFGGDVLLLVSVSISEELGRPFEIKVQLQSENEKLDSDEIIGTKALITIDLSDGSKRYFHGIVEEFNRLGLKHHHGFADYSALIVPEFSKLKHVSDCRVFTEMTIPDIIEQVVKKENGIDLDRRVLTNPMVPYDKRPFCVQYRESTFDFLSRLMEFAGIYYYFKHTDSGHVMILNDSSEHDHYPFSERYKEIRYDYAGFYGEAITAWETHAKRTSKKFVLNDYDYTETKTVLLTDSSSPDDNTVLASFDYPGGYAAATDKSDKRHYADHYAKIRLQELTCRAVVNRGSGNVLGMGAGYSFGPIIGPTHDAKQLTIGMKLDLSLPNWNSQNDPEGALVISCHFESIGIDVSFRAESITPKPTINGVQTAVVVAPADWDNEKNGPFIDGKIGNVRVQFPWDRRHKEGRNDQGNVTSSVPIRVAQISAGNGWGSMFIPHPGNEVLVAFEEGDPDRPVIVGSLYNYTNLPPVPLQDSGKPNNKFYSYICDVADNFIIFKAAEGLEQVTVFANHPKGIGNFEIYGSPNS